MKLRCSVLLLAALTLLLAAVPIRADIRLSIPQDIEPLVYTSPNGPSPFLPGVINDGEWAAIPFYRPPEFVPPNFNLMDWFDPALEDCPILVEGFVVFPGTEPTGFPRSSQLRGTGAVPVWFVKWDELQAAMSDGELTILELASLDSLIVGTASKFEEELHYQPPHQVGHSTFTARGMLADGRTFEVLAVEVDLEYELVRIEFK
jgi:hypothetical protein